jgi:hypothetical protein
MIHGTFEIDELEFKGIYDPKVNWNGFKCPYFDLETAKQVLSIQDTKEKCKENDYYYYELSEDLKSIIEISSNILDVCDSIIFEGVRYYPIGYFNWCWIKVPNWLIQERLTDEG